MRLPPFAPVLSGMLLCFGLLAVGACSSRPPSEAVAAPPPPLTLVALDRSGSTENFRDSQRGFIVNAGKDSLRRGNYYSFWAVDREANCIYDPKIPRSKKEFNDSITDEYETRRTGEATRTRPALLWEALAQKYGGAKSASGTQPVNVLYLTDGGNDWAADEPRITQAVHTLSQNPQVRVALVGVNPELKPVLETQFAPFASRVVVWGRSATLEQVADWRKGGQ